MARGRCSGRAAAFLLVLACCAARSTAMPMHPDLLSFAKLPTASLEEELEQTAARRLQQDLFPEQGGPFTFDGFGTGFGGLFPGGGFFGSFATELYQIIFRDILNEGLNKALASGITNSLQPFDFIPPEIGTFFNRDVAVLFGFDAVDKYIGQYLKRASATLGKLVDAGCTGPTYSIKVAGAVCEIADDGSVECTEPSVTLSSTPYVCSLPSRQAAKLEGQSFKYKVEFGKARKGELSPLTAGEYNFGAAANVTVPNLGFSLDLNRIANDFGVQQWYQFVGNLILNELLRVQSALLSGAVDSRILTRQRDLAAAAAPAGRAAGGPIVDGAAAVAEATNELLDKIAKNMGINTEDLRAGLDAVGAMPKPSAAPPAPKEQRQQAAAAAGRSGVPGDNGVVPNTGDAAGQGEGGKVVVKTTDEKEGDQSLLDGKVPLVTKAEGAQPQAAAPKKPAAKKAAAPKKSAAKKAAAPKKAAAKKAAAEPKHL